MAQAPFPPPTMSPPPKKGGALKWVFIGCGTFVLLGLVGGGLGIYFLVKNVAGTEVASAPGMVGQESAVTFQVVEPVPHALWIEYDATFSGGGFRLEGPIVVRTPAGVIVQDALTLGLDGPPTASSSGRVQMNSRHVNFNGQGSSAARVRLVEIPPQQVGTTVTAGVTATASALTVVRSLRLVVTR
ncbi:MAG: hypothetical protein HYY06_13405 [Deltaproteobacteria bacterium]|nr:hypothetical protein [Deltaproteobacteria bacterium]